MTPVTKPFDDVLKLIKREIDDPKPNQAVVDKLIEIGYAALVRAAESKDTGEITLNQLEAFACAVYFNGEKQKSRFLEKDKITKRNYRADHDVTVVYSVHGPGKKVTRKGAEPDPKRGRMGRSMALHELRDHKSTAKGYELYLTNAMWYSAIHENGWTMRNGAQHRPLQIITQEILDTVGQIEQVFGVTVYVDVWANRVNKEWNR